MLAIDPVPIGNGGVPEPQRDSHSCTQTASNHRSSTDSNGINSKEKTPTDVADTVETHVLSRTSTQNSECPDFDDFVQFESQVQELCRVLWPGRQSERPTDLDGRMRQPLTNSFGIKEPILPQSEQQPKRFVIEEMRGGTYNRVAGITMPDECGKVEARMMLRVPRIGVPQLGQDISNSQFVRQYTEAPVPEILKSDSTCDNPLGQSYVIQTRIPGYDLESKVQSYPDLSHQQKLVFVEEFCKILCNMQKVQHPWVGQISKSNDLGTPNFAVGPFEVFPEEETLIKLRSEKLPFFKVRPFGVEEKEPSDQSTNQPYKQSLLHFFEVQFGRWRNLEHGLDPSEQWEPTIWHRLVTAAQQMNKVWCLDSDYYCLTHYDLGPRNIMVEIQSGVPKITGIIDWDLAMFAPDWVACKPPTWIWNWVDRGSEDEALVDEEPQTAEQQELKELFDDLVGLEYRYSAYRPHYRLARQLFRFARYGLRSADLEDQAEKMLEEWNTLYQEMLVVWEED